MRTLHRNDREGMALAMAMFAIVVIGALIAGAFFASTQDFRIGSNSLVAQRAFTAAEYGLNKTMSGWDQSRNLAISVGKDTTFNYTTTDGTTSDGATSTVRATRINQYTYWLVSEGTAGVGTPVETKRRTSMVMRLAYPAIKVGGAMTLAGGGTVTGSAQVSGRNVNPVGYDCANYPGRDTTGVAYAPGTTLSINKPTSVVGAPGSYQDPNAGVDGNYIKFGDESWTTLANNADIKIANYNGDPEPVATADGKKCLTGIDNWGEPWRSVAQNSNGSSFVPQCVNYFPIIYSTTDLSVNSGRGQGILLVEGSLTVNGRFEWNGLIIVKDDINKGNGTPTITGAVMARNAVLSNGGSVTNGNATFQYSKCALESALQGSARLLPARQRAWAEMW